MTHCHNCGHTGTFVLLAQFALAVPGPDAEDAAHGAAADDAAADDAAADDSAAHDAAVHADHGVDADDADAFSLSVQCPVCDSTDVGVPASDLLARYGATTTS